MSNPISSYFARKIAKSFTETVDKSKHRNKIRYIILMSFGGLLIWAGIYRLMYYPHTTENHIGSAVVFLIGLMLFMVCILHRKATKKDVWDSYRNKKIKR